MILQGLGWIELNGHREPVVTGDVLVLEPGEDHHLIGDPAAPIKGQRADPGHCGGGAGEGGGAGATQASLQAGPSDTNGRGRGVISSASGSEHDLGHKDDRKAQCEHHQVQEMA